MKNDYDADMEEFEQDKTSIKAELARMQTPYILSREDFERWQESQKQTVTTIEQLAEIAKTLEGERDHLLLLLAQIVVAVGDRMYSTAPELEKEVAKALGITKVNIGWWYGREVREMAKGGIACRNCGSIGNRADGHDICRRCELLERRK